MIGLLCIVLIASKMVVCVVLLLGGMSVLLVGRLSIHMLHVFRSAIWVMNMLLKLLVYWRIYAISIRND